jgi:hypothetical protein
MNATKIIEATTAGTISEPLEWRTTGEDQYEARSGQRLYRVCKDSSGLSERVWRVVVLNVGSDGADAEQVAEAWPPTLDHAREIARGWESEDALWPRSSG